MAGEQGMSIEKLGQCFGTIKTRAVPGRSSTA